MLRTVTRCFAKSAKDEVIGAKRNDLYSIDVFKVTDDGIKWSYESSQSKNTTSHNSKKPKQNITINQEAMSKLPVAVTGNFSRADILKQINACVDTGSRSM